MRPFEAMRSERRANEVRARYAERFGEEDAIAMMHMRTSMLTASLTGYILDGDIARTIAFAKQAHAEARADGLKHCTDPMTEEWFAATTDMVFADILEDLEGARKALEAEEVAQ